MIFFLVLLFLSAGNAQAGSVAVKRIVNDFTGNGRAETLVFYQDKEKKVGHITLFARQKKRSVQLWNSVSLPLVDVQAHDVNDDHIAEIILFSLRSDKLLDLKILAYQRESWQPVFKEIVSQPDDLLFFHDGATILELEPIHTKEIDLSRRRYQYRQKSFVRIQSRSAHWLSHPLKEIAIINSLQSQPHVFDLLLLARKKEETFFHPYLLSPATGNLLQMKMKRALPSANGLWVSRNRFVISFCEEKCLIYLFKYPEGDITTSFKGNLVDAREGKVLFKKKKGKYLYSFYLYDPKQQANIYLFDGSWASLYSASQILYLFTDPRSLDKSWKIYDLTRGKQQSLHFPIFPKKVVPLPQLHGLLSFDDHSLIFTALYQKREELWLRTGEEARIVDVSVSPFRPELNLFLEKSGKLVLRRFSYKQMQSLWEVSGMREVSENESGFFASDGQVIYREGKKRFFPIWGNSLTKEKRTGKSFYVVQLVSTIDLRKALDFDVKLTEEEKLSVPHGITAKSLNGMIWYRVHVGRFETKADAEAFRDIMADKGYQTWITQIILF